MPGLSLILKGILLWVKYYQTALHVMRPNVRLSHFSHIWLCDPMDCSLPGSSIDGILQARILEWVAKPFSRESSRLGIEPSSLMSPALAGWFFTIRATWEAHARHISLFRHIFLNWMLDIINFTFLRTRFYCFKIVRICLADKLFGDKMNPFKLGIYIALRQLQITLR